MKKNIITLLFIVAILMIIIGVFIAVNKNNSRYQTSDNGGANGKSDDNPFDVLQEAYKKFEISDSMNGYTVLYKLIGEYQEQLYLDFVTIENYNNKKYQIIVENMDVQTYNVLRTNTYYIIDGVTYIEEKDKKYQKVEEKNIYNNTEAYLKGLSNGKQIKYWNRETVMVDNVKYEYKQYNFTIAAKDMKEIMKATSIGDLSFEKDISCTAFVDADGYVYSIKYDMASALDIDTDFSLMLFFTGYNESKDFNLNLEND